MTAKLVRAKFFLITFVAMAAFLAIITTPTLAAERMLRPRADSRTAMVKCGADLETVKNRLGATVRYTFSGQEKLTGMRYCVEPSTKHDVVDDRNIYRVPAGTVGWLAPDGRVVLEACINEAKCEGCKLAPPPVAVAPPPPAPAPVAPPAPPTPAPTPISRPPVVLSSVPSPDMASIHVFLLKKTEETKKFVRKEFDSRDAKQFVSRAYKGEIPRHTQCLPVSLALQGFQELAQGFAGYEGYPKEPVNLATGGLTMNVCGGHGMLDLPASAIVQSAVVLATPDKTKAGLYYPPSGTLRTAPREIYTIVWEHHDMNIELFIVVD